MELIYGSVAAFVLIVGAVLLFKGRKSTPEQIEVVKEPKSLPVEPLAKEVPIAQTQEREKDKPALGSRLAKTRESLKQKFTQYFSRDKGSLISDKEWDAIEEILLEGDVGVQTTTTLINCVKKRYKDLDHSSLQSLFQEEAEGLLAGLDHGVKKNDHSIKPLVISVVGINGAGKTTTIGKLAQSFQKDGKTILLGAVDTFRAGAINQLKVWAERTSADFVTGREGGDPGAVAFDAVTAGKARGRDIVLLDTAGRLHTKANLMEELKKIHRVVKKVIPEAPHETWLVIDGTLGQNSIQQAKEFQKTLNVSGVIVTKLDGTAKGGAVLSIAQDLKLPIRYIGIGESAEDLIPFEPRPFVEAIFGA